MEWLLLVFLEVEGDVCDEEEQRTRQPDSKMEDEKMERFQKQKENKNKVLGLW